jgi:H+-transporting ATPase
MRSTPRALAEMPQTSATDGLSGAEASRRLAEYGPNELVEKERSPLLTFLGYFRGRSPG